MSEKPCYVEFPLKCSSKKKKRKDRSIKQQNVDNLKDGLWVHRFHILFPLFDCKFENVYNKNFKNACDKS